MSRNTLNGTKHAAAALAVFAAVTLALLWVTGAFSSRSAHAAGTTAEATSPKTDACEEAPGEPCSKAAKVEQHEQEEAAQGGDACCPAEATGNLAPAEIEKMTCEHNVRTVDCDECRYEVGVVKVAPSVTQSLTRTARAEQALAVTTLRLTGEVQFDQARVVDVLPIAPGKVVAVKARLGQQVQAGKVLAVIRSSEFGEAKATYLEARAAAEIAVREQERQVAVSAALEKMLASLADNPAASQGASKEPLGEWRSRLVGAAARLQQARAVAERERSLVEKQASSQAEYQSAQRELQTAQADYAALAEEVQLNLSLDKLKAENAATLTRARLNAAEQRLHLFDLDDDAMVALMDAEASCQFAELEIRAPRGGTITAQNIIEGKAVSPDQPLYTIADQSNLWVWCNLYERDLAALHAAMAAGGRPRASVRVPAYDEVFQGVVDLVGSSVDEMTRTIKVRVQIPNESGKLRPGMFARTEVELATEGQVTLVPRSAVLSDEGQTFAFQHWKDDLWLRRNVVLGKVQGDRVQVLAGLDAGATVVASGAFLLKSDVLRAKMGAGCAD
jgi:cobalt-zinc-cadmium efflux system membrane fusion protein